MGGIILGASDVGVVALEEWACGDFRSYICWLNDGF